MAAGLALAVGLAGCQLTSPLTTQLAYDPADGVSVQLGEVTVRDLLVVAGAKGGPGTLSGFVVNSGDEDVTVSIGAADAAPVTAQVEANSALKLTGGDGPQTPPLPSVAADPGGIVELNVGTPTAGTETVAVPVLPPRGYYATVTSAPTSTPAAPASPAESPSPTGSATPTPTPTTS